MSEQLFTSTLGYAVENENTGLNVYENFPVSGIPGNASLPAEELSLSNNAPIGSNSKDTTTGFSYLKKTLGAGESTWVREATLDDLSQQTSSDSWRDPALVKDDTVYANLAAAELAMNTGSVDGVAVLADSRILYTNITGSSKNVYIISGTPGSGATLVEDTNLATSNDVLIVDDGTSAGIEYHYNSTSGTWIVSSGTPSNEDGFQNTYSGKPATGSQTTSFTSQNVVTNGDDLTTAIGKLDAASSTNATNISTNSTSIGNLQTEVDLIETSIGPAVGSTGLYVPHTTSNYIGTNSNITEDLLDLDAQVKLNADAIASGPGNASALGVTALTVVDSILVDSVKMVRWQVHVQQGSTVRTYEVDATHNSTPAADAVSADFTKYARLRINGNIPGLKVRVSLNGTGPTQTMNLTTEATSVVDVHTTRLQVI